MNTLKDDHIDRLGVLMVVSAKVEPHKRFVYLGLGGIFFEPKKTSSQRLHSHYRSLLCLERPFSATQARDHLVYSPRHTCVCLWQGLKV